MEKRVLIAVALSLAILVLYPYFITYISPPPAPVPETAEQAETTTAALPATEQAAQSTPETTTAAVTSKAPGMKLPGGFTEEVVKVNTPLFNAELSTIGAGVKSWSLARYKVTKEAGSPSIDLAGSIALNNSFKTQLVASGATHPLLFTPSAYNVDIEGEGTATVVFDATTESGLSVEKKYTFTGSSYMVATELFVKNTSKEHFSGGVEMTLASNAAGKDDTGYHIGPVLRNKDGVTRQTTKNPRETGAGKLDWIGEEDKYFLSAIVDPRVDNAVWVAEAPSEESSMVAVQFPVSLAPGASTSFSYGTFVGPKEYDLLVKNNFGLDESIEFGYFSFLARPLLVVLNFFKRFLVNYGLAIILLTVIIKIIFYPLTKYSLKSMKDMQRMQPQMAALKEKYKDNKDKLNKELMDLYKRHKINPMSGCLPMILQIPVFIGLYEVLYVAIELRHAPLFLWITDLSAKDPYYVTPLLMGATMFIQQKMTPTAGDPTQAKMMMLMPIIFTFMFLNFPSGLVVYWLVNNLLTIAQQYMIHRSPATA